MRRELTILRAAINHDYAHGRITRPVPVVLPQRGEAKDRWLTRIEAAALIRAARQDVRSRRHLVLFILMGLYTGARKEAILSLRWPQVDLRRRLIDFNPPGRGRTSKGRPIIPIPQRLATFLRVARDRGGDLGPVIAYRGQPVGNIKKAFHAACINAGMIIGYRPGKAIKDGNVIEIQVPVTDVTPHTLRHTCASWMAQQGVPFPVIARYLGHSDSRTTETIYSHHASDYLVGAVEALDRRRR